MLNRKITFLERNSGYNNFTSGPSLEDYLSKENIPPLENVIAQARNEQKEFIHFNKRIQNCTRKL